ncbi:MAG: DUF6290 family protein [Coriobacteriales bacterium]|jgi:hypothetical protein|nr:DUF6290 family protein [Coriobacteriales bacterium]
MGKTVSAIRFEPEEKEWIGAFAGMRGKSFSAQVREWALERLEDEMDALDLLEAVKASAPDDEGIGIAELMRRHGIA